VTVTEEGTVTVGLRLEVSETVTPAAGAAEVRATVPVIVSPPEAAEGAMFKALTLCAQVIHGTSKTSSRKRSLIGDFKIRLSFVFWLACGIGAPQIQGSDVSIGTRLDRQACSLQLKQSTAKQFHEQLKAYTSRNKSTSRVRPYFEPALPPASANVLPLPFR